jgi:hypothetical protein
MFRTLLATVGSTANTTILYMLWYEGSEAELWSQRRRPLLGNVSVNTFPRQQSRVTAGLYHESQQAVLSKSESEVVRLSPLGEGVGSGGVPLLEAVR